MNEEYLDFDYMREVEKAYLATIDDTGVGSIKETARVMEIARTKVKKILITLGRIESPLPKDVLKEVGGGVPLRAISYETGISVSTLSTYIPYKTAMHDGEIKSYEAVRKQRYRAYINSLPDRVRSVPEEQKEINEEWVEQSLSVNDGQKYVKEQSEEMEKNKEENQYPGSINDRSIPELKEVGLMEGIDRPFDLVRLHLELKDNDNIVYLNTKKKEGESDEVFAERVRSIVSKPLRLYGGVQHGHTITRDIIVPMDITLHALHYVIQKAFGWENSHLHSYTIPERYLMQLLKGGVMDWSKLVGILFVSPYMDEGAPFWDDDYERGSIRTWLRKKYTGPYISLSRAESYVQCTGEIEEFLKRHQGERYVVGYVEEVDGSSDGSEAIKHVAIECYPVKDKDHPYYKDRAKHIKGYFTKEMNFEELPYGAIRSLTYENDFKQILERLTLGEVLAFGDRQLIDETHPMADCESIYTDLDELLEEIQDLHDFEYYMKHDTPDKQPMMLSVTDTLLYKYDFGDNWRVEIRGSFNCADLVEEDRVTQEEIDAAMTKVWKTHRPVCIASDGLCVMDDVGGIDGFKTFLEEISIDTKTADDEDIENKKSWLEWAKGQGWSKRKSAPKNLL